MSDRPDWLPELPATPSRRTHASARGALSLFLAALGVALAMFDAALVAMTLVDPNFQAVNRTVFPTALAVIAGLAVAALVGAAQLRTVRDRP